MKRWRQACPIATTVLPCLMIFVCKGKNVEASSEHIYVECFFISTCINLAGHFLSHTEARLVQSNLKFGFPQCLGPLLHDAFHSAALSAGGFPAFSTGDTTLDVARKHQAAWVYTALFNDCRDRWRFNMQWRWCWLPERARGGEARGQPARELYLCRKRTEVMCIFDFAEEGPPQRRDFDSICRKSRNMRCTTACSEVLWVGQVKYQPTVREIPYPPCTTLLGQKARF